MNLTQNEKKIIMLLRKMEQHHRVEFVKIKDNEYSVKKTHKVRLDGLFLDQV